MSSRNKDRLIAAGVIAFWVGLPILAVPFAINSDSSSEQPISSDVESQVDATTRSNYQSSYVESRGTNECTEDCSGHSAGYEWARENEVCDIDFDGGNSESFAEGVRAYAEDECYYDDYYSDGVYER